MIFPGFSKTSRVWCVLTAFVCFGLSVDMASAQSNTASQATPKKTTTKKTITRKSTTSQSPRPSSARRSRARSRAAALARAVREAQEPRFRLDESGALVPDVRAEAAIIYDSATGQVLWESNSQNQRSIASITKVMTAVVFLEDSPDLSDEIVVQPSRCPRRIDHLHSRGLSHDEGRPAAPDADRVGQRRGARAGPRVEPTVPRLHRSDEREGRRARAHEHAATRIRPVCCRRTCRRRTTWRSSSPTSQATSALPSVMRTPTYTVTAGRRVINIHSTNQLVMNGDVDVQAGKTGFITKAGYCLATLLRLPQGGPAGRGRRAWRQVQRRPLLGNASPVQLVLEQGRGSARRAAPARQPRELSPTAAKTSWLRNFVVLS